MVASREPEVESPSPAQLYDVGVAGTVARMLKVPDGSLRILIQGGQRVHIDRWLTEEPYLTARVTAMPDVIEDGPELTALTRNVQETFSRIIEQVPYLPEELQMAVANLEDPSALSHLIAGALRIKTEERQELLEEVDVGRRLRRLAEILAREAEVISIGTRIQSQVQSELDRTQREYVLRQQLDAIRKELGEFDESAEEASELRRQLDVNVIGHVAVTQAVLPALRRVRGRIVLMGSIAGRSSLPFLGPYAASKHALEAIADALRVELKPWGIGVTIVEPGTIKTPIWTRSAARADDLLASMNSREQLEELYGERIASFRRVALARGAAGAPAETVAEVVEDALTATRPPTRRLVGRDARIRAAFELLPDRLRDRVYKRVLLRSD
jgi:NAD(P)-dependent dehydrogenase (short-subunit alcohol dehydrogenase family)